MSSRLRSTSSSAPPATPGATRGGTYRYLVFDAHVERVRREGEVRRTAVLWVIGVDAAGYREHRGVWLETDASATLGGGGPRRSRGAPQELASTHGIEHDHMAVRRRTRVIRVRPNEASLVRLTTALAQERNDHWLARRSVAPATDHAEVVIRAA